MATDAKAETELAALLDRLERLAKAATPGPYQQCGLSPRHVMASGVCDTCDGPANGIIAEFCETTKRDDDGREWLIAGTASDNAAFFAALDSDTILRLIAAARRAQPPGPGADELSRLEAEKYGWELTCQNLRDELKAVTKDRDRLDASETQLIDERDKAEEWADKMASAVGPIEVIGEHSNLNNPWQNAYDLIAPAAEVDALKAELAARHSPDSDYWELKRQYDELVSLHEADRRSPGAVPAETANPPHRRNDMAGKLRGKRCGCLTEILLAGLHEEGCPLRSPPSPEPVGNCPRCEGIGTMRYDEPCTSCRGTGNVEPVGVDAAWERIYGGVVLGRLADGYGDAKAEFARILSELRPSREAVEAAKRVVVGHDMPSGRYPFADDAVTVAREIIRLAGKA